MTTIAQIVRKRSCATLLVPVCAVVIAVLMRTIADPDLWGHLAFGRFIVRIGYPWTDPYSYALAGERWINHEWLSQVLMYLAFTGAGPSGLIALKVAVLSAMIGLVLVAVRKAGGGDLASVVVTLALLAGGLPSFITLRPHTFTYLLFPIFLLAVFLTDQRKSHGLLWLTPLLAALWANLHGGVAAGVAVLWTWGGLRLGQAACRALGVRLPTWASVGTPTRSGARAIACVLALQIPATLITPYGLDLWRLIVGTTVFGLHALSEWQPATVGTPTDMLRLAGLGILLLPWLLSPIRRDPVHLCLLVPLLGAGLSARRHVTLALIAAAVLGAPHAARVLRRRSQGRTGPAWLSALVIVLAGGVLATGIVRNRCIRIEPGTFPRAAVAYLDAAQVSGRLAVFFDWGNYALWRLAPRLSVSTDSLSTTPYPPRPLREHLAFLNAEPGWRAMLDDQGVDLALLSPRYAVYGRLATEPDWRLAFADDISGLFVRRESAADEALRRTALPPRVPEAVTCFGESTS